MEGNPIFQTFGLTQLLFSSIGHYNKSANNTMKRITFLLLGVLAAIALPAQISQNVSLIGHWTDSTINVFNGNQYNEVWTFVQGGVEYAAVGTTEGVSIIDLSDPANPVEVDEVVGETNEAIHRDMDDHDGYLYMVCDQGASRLKIADLSYLPDSVHVVYDSQEHVGRVHNIFIDSTSGHVYCFAASDSLDGSLPAVVVLEFDPLTNSVAELGFFDSGSQFIQSHDGYVVNDTAFVNMWNDGLYMIDFSDPVNPATIGQFPFYPGTIANHSGWPDPERGLYVMADEWMGTEIKIMDVSDPSNISLVHSFLPGSSMDIIPHNLMVNGRFLFLSAYTDGLRIFDLYDPQNPVLTGFYDTYPGSDLDIFEGAWGINSLLPSGLILVSDQRYGLFIFDVGPALARVDEDALHAEVWPVPARNVVRLQWSQEELQAVAFRLRTVDGRVLERREVEPFGEAALEVDLGGVPAGLYLLELEGENGERIVEKVVRE